MCLHLSGFPTPLQHADQRPRVQAHLHQAINCGTRVCQRKGIEEGIPVCQQVAGEAVDGALADLLLATVTPMALEVALAVQAELEGRAVEADQLRRQHVERARHHVELARRRYLAVDPDNRLVAASLEADWNDALRAFTQAQEDHERQSARAQPLGDDDKARIAALATDFPALWSDPRTPQRERKRMVRLLLDDVTLLRSDHIAVHVRFKGGQTTSLTLPLPLPAPDLRRTPADVVAEVDRLLDDHTDAGVAAALNQAGIHSGTGQAFHAGIIVHIRNTYQLRRRAERLKERGLVSLHEAAAAMGVHPSTVKNWHHAGRIDGEPLNDKGSHYYKVPAVAPFKPVGRPPKTARPTK